MSTEKPKNGQSRIIALMQEELIRIQSNNPSFSLRAFSKRLGIVPSAASEIMSGKRKISPAMAKTILEGLEVDPKEINTLLLKLGVQKRNIGAKEAKTYTPLDMSKYHVISDWYYFAILSLAETKDFVDTPEWSSKRLNITMTQARQGLKRLEDLGMLRRDEREKLTPTGKKFKTSNDIKSLALRRSHLQTLDLAKSAIIEGDVEQRDVGSITMAIDPRLIPEAKEMIREFRVTLSSFLESGEKREVYRFATQLFSLTNFRKHKRNGDKE